ncbi:MAG TPA: hypothetical protein VMM38_15890 [Aridibacter sp.]|nr:hypothetical protein [Aridibacter sp.]
MKKIFLTVLVVSVALSAVVGIIVILIGNFGEFESKVLMTTFSITCASILGLACGPAYESGRGRPVALAGIVLAVLAGVSWLLIIWARQPLSEPIVKSIMTLTVLAVVFAHVSLVLMARLEKKFLWALYALYLSVAALAGLVLSLIWFTEAFESDLTFRILGVLSILVAALTILLPVLHKLSDSESGAAKIDAEIERLRARIAALEARKSSTANE